MGSGGLPSSSKQRSDKAGNPYRRGRHSTIDLIVLIRLANFDIENIIYVFTKQAYLMRRSTVLSLPVYLGFPGEGIYCMKKSFFFFWIEC